MSSVIEFFGNTILQPDTDKHPIAAILFLFGRTIHKLVNYLLIRCSATFLLWKKTNEISVKTVMTWKTC